MTKAQEKAYQAAVARARAYQQGQTPVSLIYGRRGWYRSALAGAFFLFAFVINMNYKTFNSPSPMFVGGHTLTSDDVEYEYASIQEEIDGVKEALAEWEMTTPLPLWIAP